MSDVAPSGAVLIVPAAGVGSRLGSAVPKVLAPVAGRPMIDYLLDLYTSVVNRFILVVRPGVEAAVMERGRVRGLSVECEHQVRPTGMLDAILAPLERVRALAPRWVWITWCDQVAVRPETVRAVSGALDAGAELVLATCRQPDPYVHFDRDEGGRIRGLRQRREGDAMPASGESDAGLFVLSHAAYTSLLPAFAAGAGVGDRTGERNFLPFVVWLSARALGAVRSVPCRDVIESVGVNTPDELRRVEAYLAARAEQASRPASS